MNNDLISREWLTNAIRNRRTYLSYEDAKDVIDLIDNAPTVDITEEQAIDKLHETGWLPMHDKEMTERPQGECKDCKHFQKSLCENSPNGWCSIRRATQEGDLETQVPKDYYCSWFKKGGAE